MSNSFFNSLIYEDRIFMPILVGNKIDIQLFEKTVEANMIEETL